MLNMLYSLERAEHNLRQGIGDLYLLSIAPFGKVSNDSLEQSDIRTGRTKMPQSLRIPH